MCGLVCSEQEGRQNLPWSKSRGKKIGREIQRDSIDRDSWINPGLNNVTRHNLSGRRTFVSLSTLRNNW